MTSSDSSLQSRPGLLKTSLLKTVSFVWIVHRKLFVSLIVSLAIVLLALRGLAFYLEENPYLIEELIETRLQTRVTFDELKVAIHPLYPSVSMHNFTIRNESEEEKLLEFASASIRLDIPRSILRGQIIIDTLALKGLSAILHRNTNNEISIAEFQLPNAQKSKPDSGKKLQSYFSLLDQTNFMISESKVFFIDEMQKIPTIRVSDIDFRMKNNNERHQISLLARLNESDTYLDFHLDFKGKVNDISNWDGKVYAAVDNLNQQTLLHFLKKEVLQVEEFQLNDIEANSKVWSTINKGRLQSIHGELVVEDANLTRVDNNHSIHFDTVSTNFKLERKHTSGHTPSYTNIPESVKKETNWILDLYNLNLSVNSKKISEKYIHLKFHKAENEPLSQMQIFFNKLDFNEFSHIISFFSPKKFNEKVFSILKPRGSLENIMTTFQFNASEMPIDIQHYQVQTDINDFGMNSLLSLPKIRHFSAQLVFNETVGRATIDSLDMKLHLKSLFRDVWPISQLTGEFFWQKEGDEWLLGGEALTIKSPHFAANADLNLWISENGQSFMELTAFYQDVNVEAVSNYLPAKIMNKGLVKWLDNALISGKVPDGGIVFRGNLGEFPYKKHSGNMDIVFNTKDVLLEFQKDWPKLSNINAQVQFTQKGMKIEGKHGKIFSAKSQNIQVDLEQYLERIILIKGDIKSSLDDGLKFLQQSKLVSNDVLNIIDAKDEIDINLDLKIPLKEGKADTKTRIRLNNADYYPPGFERKKGLVSHLKGDIVVHNQSINSKNLFAEIMGLPAKIIIKTDKPLSESKKDPNVGIAIDSEISIEQLKKFNLISESLLPLSDQLSGTSNIKLNIDLPNAQRALAFNLYTGLANISSNLPPPFNKQAKTIFPFVMSFTEIKSSEKLLSKKNKQIKSALLKMEFSQALSLAFLLDISSGTDDFKLLKGNVAFTADKAKLPKDNILKITGRLRDVPFGQWQSVFASYSQKTVAKKTSPLEKFSIPVELAVTELVLPELQSGKNDSDKPESSSGTGSSFEAEYFPLVNGYIGSLKLGKLDLGRFSMQSSRVDKHIVFDKLVLDGALFSFNGKGKWHHLNARPEVILEGKAETPSLEKLAVALGNDHLVRQAKAQISGYISWPGGLNDYSKETIEGTLNISVEKGAWIEGKPGAAGRLLGLLNMNALVRRLSLDFSDVSDEGFQFDRIEGDFRFKNAMAYTDNLRIFSPSAKILVTGSTGLVTEDIDQRVTVVPEVSATLPLAGAAVAGPAGAAVVWVGQKLLGDHLNQVTAFDYTIKGNWNQPVIKKDKTSKNTLNNIKRLFKVKKSGPTVQDGVPVLDTNTSELP